MMDSFLDYPFSAPGTLLTTYVLLFYVLFYKSFYFRFVSLNDSYKSPTSIKLYWIVFIFLMTHWISGDFFHYLERTRLYGTGVSFSQEEVYNFLMELSGNSYLIFRLIVWGGAFTLYYWTLKRFNISRSHALFVFFTMYIYLFAYARASLAMAIYFLGLSFICVPTKKNKFLGCIFGISLIILSYQFHHSIIAAIVMTLLIFVPINRNTLTLMLFASPFVIRVMISYFQLAVDDQLGFDDEVINRKLQGYTTKEVEEDSLRGIVMSYWQYATIYVPFIIIIWKVIYNKTVNIDSGIQRLIKVILGIVLLATGFLFLNLDYNAFFYRTLYMAIIPMSIVITYMRQNMLMSDKQYKFIIWIGFSSLLINYLYSLYNTYLNFGLI